MASLWPVGIALGVLASMAGTVGKQLFRASELQRRRGTSGALAAARATRAAAVALNAIVGPLVDMASYAFAPQSLIAPLGALDVVWNTMTAPCTLGEKLTLTTLGGCALIFSGALATSVVGGKHDGSYAIEDVQRYLVRWRTLMYLVCLAAWLLFNISVLMPRSANPRGEAWASGDSLRGLSLAMTAGSLSGNMFCVKAFVEIVQGSIAQQTAEPWAHWLPYAVLVGAVFFAVSNLYFLDKAMREYEALFTGAVFEGTLILTASVSGFVVFDEIEHMQDAMQIVAYWLALGSIVLGIHVVARDAARRAREMEAPKEQARDGSEQASCSAGAEECGDGLEAEPPTLCVEPTASSRSSHGSDRSADAVVDLEGAQVLPCVPRSEDATVDLEATQVLRCVPCSLASRPTSEPPETFCPPPASRPLEARQTR